MHVQGDAVTAKSLLAALLCLGCVTTVAAQEVTRDEQRKDEPAAAPAAQTALKDCVVFTSDFRAHNGVPAYVITLENKCERRFRCKVNVNVTNAFGSTHGQATLRLGAHAAGDVAKKTWALKVKQLGGMAQESRQCEVL
jgi:hypothetical protein